MTRFWKSIEAITFPTPSKCATCYATDAGSLNSHEAVKIDNMPCNDTNVNAATQMCAFFQCLIQCCSGKEDVRCQLRLCGTPNCTSLPNCRGSCTAPTSRKTSAVS